MGKLDEQIKILQRKKSKIELYERIIANLKKETPKNEEFPGLMQEVAESVSVFCRNRIDEIEDSNIQKVQGKAPVKKVDESAWGEAEEEVLVATPEPIQDKPKKSKIVISEDDIYNDALKFVVHFRDSLNRKVVISDEAGNKMDGELVGASFPNLKVKVAGKVVVMDPRNVKVV